ncbi:MAG TPA: alpha/beta fold hydrolase [Nonomuraea sp.]|uniref:alpha/beta fold hydrolase n=1 Tax=Nonomuraea sp. NPDC049649 TaxID=3155776 RepID=UPI002C1FB46D|nr:alpha/beta fold hydrolase [Nonomuraea sp.]
MSITITTSVGETYVAEVGSGRPILVLHGGLGLDHGYLRAAFDTLADRHRVVYLDFVGNGRSDRTLDYAAIRDNTIWVRQVDEVIEAMGLDNPVIVGHSYGGYVALEYALTPSGAGRPMILVSTAPKLDHSDVIAENAARRGTPEQVDAVRVRLARPQASDDEWADLWRTLLPLYFHAPTPELVARASEGTYFSAEAFNTAHLRALSAYDVSGRLGEITSDTLVVSGDDDWILPLELCSQRLAAGIPGAALAVLPECGHFPFIERPEPFLTVVRDWLERH